MSASKTDLTVEDCLRGAWDAILRGDYETRDKLCAMAERAFKDNQPIPGTTLVPLGKEGAQ